MSGVPVARQGCAGSRARLRSLAPGPQVHWLTLDATIAPVAAELFSQLPAVDTTAFGVDFSVRFSPISGLSGARGRASLEFDRFFAPPLNGMTLLRPT